MKTVLKGSMDLTFTRKERNLESQGKMMKFECLKESRHSTNSRENVCQLCDVTIVERSQMKRHVERVGARSIYNLTRIDDFYFRFILKSKTFNATDATIDVTSNML